jgi:hypothetical protein
VGCWQGARLDINPALSLCSLNGSSERLGSRTARGYYGQPTAPAHRVYLTVECRSAGCGGERTFAISDLSTFYKDRTLGEVLRLMRCSRGCGSRVLAAWLETGPILNQRVRLRRVPEARE